MVYKLVEVDRHYINSRNRQDRARYARRLNYRPITYQGINLDKFFRYDTLDYHTTVGDYTVNLSYDGPFSTLQVLVGARDNKIIELKDLVKALSESIDQSDEVLVACTCPDWKYRFAYWSTQRGYNYGKPQNEKPKYTKTNSEGNGATCKHVSSLLTNKLWIMKVASVLNNYIKLNKNLTYEYIFGKDWDLVIDEPIDDLLDINDDTIDINDQEETLDVVDALGLDNEDMDDEVN